VTVRPFVKLIPAPVPDVSAAAELSPAAAQLTSRAPTAEALLAALVEKALWLDAVRWLGNGLLQREAVWWACLAARSGASAASDPRNVAAVTAAEAWVFKPNEENRRAAMSKAQATKFDNASAWAAVAAFWSGGSMVGPDLPVVPPPPFLIGRAVSGAVMLAAVDGPAAKIDERYRHLVAQGMDIAAGGNGRIAPLAPATSPAPAR
jgi:hypothetical protein